MHVCVACLCLAVPIIFVLCRTQRHRGSRALPPAWHLSVRSMVAGSACLVQSTANLFLNHSVTSVHMCVFCICAWPYSPPCSLAWSWLSRPWSLFLVLTMAQHGGGGGGAPRHFPCPCALGLPPHVSTPRLLIFHLGGLTMWNTTSHPHYAT